MRKLIKRSKALFVILAFSLAFAPMAVLADAGEKEEINYVALGDSLAKGTLNNGSEGTGYVGGIIEELEVSGYEVNVTNKGENGFTTADVLAGLGEIETELESADIITISAGANDVLADLIALIRENPGLHDDFEPEYLTDEGIAQLYLAVENAQRKALEATIAAATAKEEALESVKTAKKDIIDAGAATNLLIVYLREEFANNPIVEGFLAELEATIDSAVDSVLTEPENIDQVALENASEALISAVDLIEGVEDFIPEEHKEAVQTIKNIINGGVTAADDAKAALVNANDAENAAIEALEKAEETQVLLENMIKLAEALEEIPGKIPTVGENIGEILDSIKGINPTAEIYVMGYYNALPYLDDGVTRQLLNGLNGAITGVAGANFVPTAHLFEKNNYLPNPYNIHPNEAGYAAIADAFMEQIRESFAAPAIPIEEPQPESEDLPTELQINLGDKTEISKGQWIYINDTMVRILMPDDLPEGTTLTATVTNENALAKAEGLHAVGDVLHFDFNFPEGEEDYEGMFTLLMGYDTDAKNEADIYYYNEKGVWERQEGDDDKESQEISLDVSHFSNYGVFTKADQPIKEEVSTVKNKPTEKPGKDINGSDIKDGEEQVMKQGAVLPSTATNYYNMLLIGLLLIGFAGVTWYLQRKRQQTE